MYDLSRLFARFPRPAARWSRLFGLAAIVGVLAGLAAAGLEAGLHFGSHLLVGRFAHLGGAAPLRFHWGVLVLPAIGGLFSGLVVHRYCRRSHGSGTDVLVRAFHHGMGDLPLRNPLIKAPVSVGVIACGGSTGPEGPIAALGAAIGSTMGKLFSVTPHERRIMLIAGCAGGVGAIFQCPLGGALFAASILYREPEFESDAIVPSFVASVISYSTYMLFWDYGHHLLSGVHELAFTSPLELVSYALLGPLCGGVSILFGFCFRLVERKLVPWSRLPMWAAPALGGLATGGLACLLPQVMDSQYLFLQRAVDQSLFLDMGGKSWWWWTALFGAVTLTKCVATAFTVGSGASGGLIGPAVFIGGAAGAFLGAALEALYPGMFPEHLRRALIPVGMGGVLAASMRTPMAAIVMVTEMTGSYGLIVPLMLVCVVAYVVGRSWALVDDQVRSSTESPAHAADAIVHVLESWKVEQLTERNWEPVAPPNATLGKLIKLIQPGTRPVFAVVRNGQLVGLISVADIQRIMDEPALAHAVIAADIMTERLSTVYPDDDLYQAMNEFKRGNHDVLPVVTREGRRWLGMLTRERAFQTIRRSIEDMHKVVLREHAGLDAIRQEGQLENLVMGVTQERTDKIQRLLVPMQAVGLSLREADFRRNYGAQVIAIELPDGTLQCPPDIDAPLQTDQRLVAIVWDHAKTEPAKANMAPFPSPDGRGAARRAQDEIGVA